MSKPNNMSKSSVHDEELDLFQLMRSLWVQKWLILAITILFTVLAAVYAFLKPSIYQARSIVEPPRTVDIAQLNLVRTLARLDELERQDIYEVFTRKLLSPSMNQWFIREYYQPYLSEHEASFSEDELGRRFQKVLQIRLPEPGTRTDSYEVIVRLTDPELAARWSNVFVEEASRRAIVQLKGDSVAQVANEIEYLSRSLQALKATAEKQRNDRVTRLKEALSIAQEVGLVEPMMGAPSNTFVFSGRNDNEWRAPSVRAVDERLFMLGSKAIQSELNLIEQRGSDAPFIENLRELEGQLTQMEDLSMDDVSLAVHSEGVRAGIPDEPVSPVKPLIIFFGALIGCLLGVCMAAIRLLRKRFLTIHNQLDIEKKVS